MTDIHLDDAQKAFIEQQIKHGPYRDADDVVSAGLRLLESNHGKLAELRRMIDDADRQIANGEGVSFSDAESLTDYIVKAAREQK